MSIWDKINRRPKKSDRSQLDVGQDTMGDVANRLDEFSRTAPGAKRETDIAAAEAGKLLAEIEASPKKKFASLYKEFREFKNEIERRERKLEQEQQIQEQSHQETGVDDEFIFSPEYYSIIPPDYADGYNAKNKAQREEQIRKYENLRAKGYIGDVDSLTLPYILERQESGQTLLPAEQAILNKTGENINEAYTNAVVMLQTIGLIKNYEEDFPKTGIKRGLMTLVVNYSSCWLDKKGCDELFQVLATEAASPDQIELPDLPYPVAITLERLRGVQQIDRSRHLNIEDLALRGLRTGTEYDEVLRESRK